MQVGWIKYSKSEEKICFKSMMLGIFLGLPLGILLNYYVLGFPILNQPPKDFFEWFIFLSSFIGKMASVWFLFTTISLFYYYRKKKLLKSWRDIGRIVWFLFIFFPVLFAYVALVLSAFDVPLTYATPWLTPIRRYSLSLLLLYLPFLFLFFIIFMPDQKPRRIIRHTWLILNRKKPFPKLSLKNAMAPLLISIWLLLVFLPLPDSPLIHIVIIVGGLAVIIFLTKQRLEMKKR